MKHQDLSKTKHSKIYQPKIILSQISVESKNLEKNFARMKESIDRACELNADLIVFSELCLPGYFNGDWWESTAHLELCEQYHQKIADLSKNIDILFGSVGIDWKSKNEDGRVRKYNAAFFAHQGSFKQNTKTQLNFWPKTLLPQYREFDDSRHFFDLRKLAYEKQCRLEDLYEPVNIQYNGYPFIIGLSICEDMWDENYSISPLTLFSQKYDHDVFVNLSASPFTHHKMQKRDALIKDHAQKLKTNFIYVNCVGTQNIGKTIYTFDGSSKVFNKDGDMIASGKFCEEDFISFQTNKKTNLKTIPVENTFISTAQKLLEYSIKETCKKWDISRVVLGLSGGIDSALTSVLCARTLGSENVYLVNMPTQFNAQITQDAAKNLAHNLGCPYSVIPIEQTVANKKEQINSVTFQGKEKDISVHLSDLNFENIQARERGSGILATLASALGAVFVCNTNKTELTIGYGTLYGDLSGFLCPIGDLWKSQVYELALYYNNTVFQSEIIPNEIFKLPPSAELSPNQDVLQGKGDPLIYEYHDALFATWIEHWDRKTILDCVSAYKNDSIDKMLSLASGKTKSLFPTFEIFHEDLQKWWNLFVGLGAIKRVQSPPILAISKRAFGLDYRESI